MTVENNESNEQRAKHVQPTRIPEADALKIWHSARIHASKMGRHYHLDENEAEELHSRLFAEAMSVTAAKWSPDARASISTYGGNVCRMLCGNFGRAIKSERELDKRHLSIDNAFDGESGELADLALASIEDPGARNAFSRMFVKDGLEAVFRHAKPGHCEVIAALILADGDIDAAAKMLYPNVSRSAWFRYHRVPEARRAFAKIYFGKTK